jgi:hypothetical protein
MITKAAIERSKITFASHAKEGVEMIMQAALDRCSPRPDEGQVRVPPFLPLSEVESGEKANRHTATSVARAEVEGIMKKALERFLNSGR